MATAKKTAKKATVKKAAPKKAAPKKAAKSDPTLEAREAALEAREAALVAKEAAVIAKEAAREAMKAADEARAADYHIAQWDGGFIYEVRAYDDVNAPPDPNAALYGWLYLPKTTFTKEFWALKQAFFDARPKASQVKLWVKETFEGDAYGVKAADVKTKLTNAGYAGIAAVLEYTLGAPAR